MWLIISKNVYHYFLFQFSGWLHRMYMIYYSITNSLIVSFKNSFTEQLISPWCLQQLSAGIFKLLVWHQVMYYFGHLFPPSIATDVFLLFFVANKIRLWNKGVDADSFHPRFRNHEMRIRLRSSFRILSLCSHACTFACRHAHIHPYMWLFLD